MRRGFWAALAALLVAAPATAGESLWINEGNRMRVVEIASIDAPPLRERVLIRSAADDPAHGRDVNGQICALPDGSGRFVAGEDTGQPHPAAGWGVFAPDGAQVGKLTPTYTSAKPEPYGCAFDAAGRLVTSEVGDVGFWKSNGQLLLWFPPFDRFPGPAGAYPRTDAGSGGFCRLAGDLGTAGAVAIDRQERVYVTSASRFRIWRFLPPFPSRPDGDGACVARNSDAVPSGAAARREKFLGTALRHGLATYTGVALSPRDTLYVASVATGRIGEFDLDGNFLRLVLDSDDWLPPHATGTPQGLAVDAQGTLYYADLDLRWKGFWLGPGPDGKVWRIRFAPDGSPRPPEVVLEGLAFPDGLGILPAP
jgi:hypothetical protein